MSVRGIAGYALDPERAEKLWDISLPLITKSVQQAAYLIEPKSE